MGGPGDGAKRTARQQPEQKPEHGGAATETRAAARPKQGQTGKPRGPAQAHTRAAQGGNQKDRPAEPPAGTNHFFFFTNKTKKKGILPHVGPHPPPGGVSASYNAALIL